MPARKMDLEQITEQIHALAFDALDRRAYATAAALCRTLSELDGLLAIREMQRDAGRGDQGAVRHVPLVGATRTEYARHGHLAVPDAGSSSGVARCHMCGTAGVVCCDACAAATPGTVRDMGGACGKCGTSYIVGADVPLAPPAPVRDAAQGAATSVSWLRGVRRGRRRAAGTPWAGDTPAQDGDWPGPTGNGDAELDALADRIRTAGAPGLTPVPGAPGMGDAPTETMSAVCPDEYQPPHPAGSHPDMCGTCSQADPRDKSPGY